MEINLVECPACKKSVSSEATSCPHCGQPLKNESVKLQDVVITESKRSEIFGEEKSEKSYVGTLLICFFLGSLGIHRFYVGKVGTGLLMLFTGGGCGVWTLIDFIMIAVGSFRDSENKVIKN